ncbi:TadA family conjugal transfer-associated ATPase [Actinocrinis puniceicyclus]|uniref:TadA family conjugal transfer-associated ATPase n=1 Tax=Actinocrinis puniceicyclus TaxID=977794 RepID=A0A8J7WMW8_9ACTN|nr:TadA family conjugal transfer-associated ATPase [Actinocrinis puniceicyclus]MBS2962774.1 TadA family conjugal transfer-associated ATPase [Actinocrinis puniceicyclus]
MNPPNNPVGTVASSVVSSEYSPQYEGVLRTISNELAAGVLAPEVPDVIAALRARRCLLGRDALQAIAESLCEQALAADPVAGLIADPDVTDVLVNGPTEIWVERANRLERVDAGFPDEAAVRKFAQRLAVQAGRRFDDASPFVDARLPDGTRLHAVLPPVAVNGTTVSLRIPRRRLYSLEELTELGALNATAAAILEEIVRKRVPFLVTGGAGTGKTTLLSTLLSLCAPDERLVLVEDCAELMPDHPHVVRLESRPANQEGRGQVTIRDLIKQALRMRPTRIVLGEARGAEIMDLFNALNTGHEGGCGTLHANRPHDIPARIEALALLAGVSREAVHSQASAALRIAIHLDRNEFGRRYLQSIAVVRRRNAVGPVQATLAVSFDQGGQMREWPGLPQLLDELGRPARPDAALVPRGFEAELTREFPATATLREHETREQL